MSALLKINVNDHTEKKNNLTYLSWAWAWAEVLKHDPEAIWVCHTYGHPGHEEPCMRIGKTAMVHVSVTIKNLRRECMLPVMDHRNKAIQDPDAFAVNTAIMRCMTKAISMHGLGLYIYAGEDLPEQDESEREAQRRDWIEGRKAAIMAAKTSGELKKIMAAAIDMVRSQGDQPAEDELNEAFAAKLETAKKEPA
mgnify:FL=1|jgi:hypothetical protein